MTGEAGAHQVCLQSVKLYRLTGAHRELCSRRGGPALQGGTPDVQDAEPRGEAPGWKADGGIAAGSIP
ncbi:hypothetical protein WJX84_000803 [Apatococcus fuscideae]|uniref:Uncharacterized protein n=1 Tax=Apatococcus fuscideae TaxID=2026836 RepID=A0AAW1T5V6_9CHLO